MGTGVGIKSSGQRRGTVLRSLFFFSHLCVCSCVCTWVPGTGYEGAIQCLASCHQSWQALCPEVLTLIKNPLWPSTHREQL